MSSQWVKAMIEFYGSEEAVRQEMARRSKKRKVYKGAPRKKDTYQRRKWREAQAIHRAKKEREK